MLLQFFLLPVFHSSPASDPLAVFRGWGAWVDVYDWSNDFTKGRPTVGEDEIAAMGKAGVTTVYIQTTGQRGSDAVLEPERLARLIDKAHDAEMMVVGWYVPTFVDVMLDSERLAAIAEMDVDGIGVDIEDKRLSDVPERSRRVEQMSATLRETTELPIAAVILPPVFLESVTSSYWPDFPYTALAPSYDAWVVMGYWTDRRESSGWRDAQRYTAENDTRLREHVGDETVPIHHVGGIGDETSEDDLRGFFAALEETGAIGGGLYDWRATPERLQPLLAELKEYETLPAKKFPGQDA